MRSQSVILCIALFATACGGSDTPTNPSPPTGGGGGGTGGGGTGGNPPVATTTITITATGVSPQRITVSPGTRVTFVNNDNRNHEMNSDPHPQHGDCPGIDDVGFLAPGQTKMTGNLNAVRTCGFHDHNQPTVTSLQGQIVVQ
jgi:plastocyanin